ncbi:LacI family DNA-binding transcriptional regulator [Spiractinospora alimapuensis]|nr:LacI family DNA-binding transcriptional regulator [Spiractinospora alimapuensis]
MADVAHRAGVSHQTVSRVLNDHPNVRPETRERVRSAIEELGYHRNSSARALVTRRTNVLGVVAFETTHYGPASTLFSIEQAARDAGYFVSIVSLKTITPGTVREAVDYLSEQSVDGFIVIAPQRAAVDSLGELPDDLPLVAVEGGEAPRMPVACVDQYGGAYMATEHLLALGHRRVLHVAGPPDWLEAEHRVAGWRAALTDAGIDAPDVIRGDWSPSSGYEAGLSVVRHQRGASAVFVANDQMALGVLRAFGESGIRVPEDVSVVGFDDIPEAAFFSPPLTTVWQDFASVGKSSIQLLLDRIDGDRRFSGEPRRIVVPARLIERGSTSRVPATRD